MMTKLFLNGETTKLQPGDVITYNKSSGEVTATRGKERLRFCQTVPGGDEGICFGEVENPYRFMMVLVQLITAITGLNVRRLPDIENRLYVELTEPAEGDA